MIDPRAFELGCTQHSIEWIDKHHLGECPWCSLTAVRSKLAQYAQAALAPDNEVRRRVHELHDKLERMRSVVAQFDRSEIDDGDCFMALCAILEEQQ